jgi:hypothetical protein
MRLVFKEIGDSLACIYLSTGAQDQPKASETSAIGSRTIAFAVVWRGSASRRACY